VLHSTKSICEKSPLAIQIPEGFIVAAFMIEVILILPK
jgi:hypothetical protein